MTTNFQKISHRGTEAQRNKVGGNSNFFNAVPLCRRVRYYLFILLSIVLSGNLFAQANEPMRISLDDAVEMALRNNLSLESSRVNLETRRRASALSWNQFIPEVMVAGNFRLPNERETINGLHPVSIGMDPVQGVVPFSMDGPRWTFSVPIQASLTLSMAMFENMSRLRLDYENGLIAYDRAKLQLERDIRKMYNNLLLLQVNIMLLNEHFEAAERRVQTALANFRAGRAPELTYLQAQVAMENMRPTIDQAENGLRLSMANFAMFLGLDFDTQFELEPLENVSPYSMDLNFVSLDVNELIKQAAANKPDIQELRHTILMMNSARRAQSNANLPFLNLSWDFTPTFVPDPANEWRRSGAFSVTLGWRLHSLLPFSRDTQAVRNIDDQITAAGIGLAQMVQGTEIEVYNTILTLDRIRTTAEAQARTINLAERTYRLTLQAFQSGLQDLMQVQNAELELRQARVQMLEQQFNYLNGLIDLEYSIGVPFGSLSSGL